MTFASKNIEAFIHLLQNTPELFNTQDRQTLVDQIPEDIESISEFLLAWCEQRPEINVALQQVLAKDPAERPTSPGSCSCGRDPSARRWAARSRLGFRARR